MRGVRLPVAIVTVLLVGLVATLPAEGAAIEGATAGTPANGGIVDVPVSFSVVNKNDSKLPCAPEPDGLPYIVRGSIVAPRSALVGRGARAVTLYLHSPVLAAQAEWRFDAVPGYDYARIQAQAGHASVVIDRLGYGNSDIPPGGSLCYGSAADVAHQIVQALRLADYVSPAMAPVAFERVALAGFSGGGLTAEVEAYSFADVDALIVIGWAESGHAPGFVVDGGPDAAPCATGGDPKRDGAAGGYVLLFKDGDEFERWMFENTEDDVLAAARAAHERDPCGEIASVGTALTVNLVHLGEIDVPVLLIYGAVDEVYPDSLVSSPARDQRERFTGSDDVTLLRTPDAGHVVMLEQTADAFRNQVSGWLSGRGF